MIHLTTALPAGVHMLQVTSLKQYTSPKIISVREAAQRIKSLKKAGKTVGLCHGGYDLLHPGHVTHFRSAKKACDVLLVSVTSDRWVSGRKGLGRPVFTDILRAFMIASLHMVDYVVITDFKSGVDVINLLRPSLYIKGPDFIGKQTPGITAEREAISRNGGKMLYTDDPKLSTTEVIAYIKNNIIDDAILLIIDRDGTLISDDGFFGKNKKWKEQLTLNKDVASFLYYLQTKYTTTKIVASNQTGVARGFFTEATVQQIHKEIEKELDAYNVKINSWQYCPDADEAYARIHPEYTFIKSYVRDKTKRKPSPDMVTDALNSMKLTVNNFRHIFVIGDRDEDKALAENLKGFFIDVKGKSYQKLLEEFVNLTKKQ